MLDPATTSYIVLALLAVLLVIGTHIGVALGLAGILGMYLTIGPDAAWAQLAMVPFATTNSFMLAVIPLFILMGSFATQANLTTDLYRTAYAWLGRLPGGLAIATTFASAAFGAASGSTVVNAAVFTRMALPEMTRLGYDKRLSAGCIAASGTLAALIPPSILMVIYAIITEQSIGKIMLAGLVPGLLTAIVFMGGIYVRVKLNPSLAPMPKEVISWGERWKSLYGVWGIGVLFLLVIGGIYAGLFTPTYAGAIGAFGALLIVILKRRLTGKSMLEIIKDTGITSTTIFIIIIGGMLFARFLTYTGVINDLSAYLISLELAPYTYLLCFIVVFLILGMFIESIAIMVMTLPVMYPVLTGVGYDPIWLGIISVKLAEISLCTPPVGLNVYVVRSASPVPLTLENVFSGVMPFVVMDFLVLAVLIFFPQLSLFIPNMMS
ncbi:C4-dicarboxylate ABC transporter permease [Agaricicola taiwanensis]|uniref:TRAP transporter large permease protein n=1 Tax=Agaricicola taiwanensis TaxID=591372 RepID=A0A8J2VLP7_9RHOB|nr:TRAP transporter large permease [Agaricicola taiwanensis]GGE31946.1 C4-dicarboxylate ABC transporter permease [Agaricicola taiwanensis]